MDCKTARLLLDYARPRSRELDAVESRALEAHLADCADCDQLARAERRADEAIGQAMRRVDVPDQLRARLLARLKEERVEGRRHRVVYGLCGGAVAAAAMLLLAVGLWRWYAVRPAFPAERLLTDANNIGVSPPDREQVRQAFKDQGVETMAPADVNYSNLSWMFLANVEGRQTPLLLFKNRNADAHGQAALVYIVSDNQFDVNALPPHPQASNEYEYKCAVRRTAGSPYGYVIYYTGDNLGWLDPPVAPVPVSGVGN